MQPILKAIILLVLLCQFTPSHAGRCTGSAYCSACKNCSSCKHCNGGGGTCGVCSGGDSYKESRNANSSYGTTTPDQKNNRYNSGSPNEPGVSTRNTNSTYNYPVEEKKGSHMWIWIVLVLIVIYLFGKTKNKS
jgi:hypothetical protein